MVTRAIQEYSKSLLKAVKKKKTKDYVKLAEAGHKPAQKVLAMAKKPHKAKKAYMLSIRKTAKGKPSK